MGTKRPGNSIVLMQEHKRPKNELVLSNSRSKALVESRGKRTSELFAPIVLLEGHNGEIYTTEFDSEGQLLLSSGHDRQIYLWNVSGECENVLTLSGHAGAVLEAHFSSDDSLIYSCSSDKTIALWDLSIGQRVRRLKGHSSFVNSVDGNRRGQQMLCSGSDDKTIRMWDIRKKNFLHTFDNQYQITSVCFNDTADQIICGGIDNEIKIWDVRKQQVLHRLRGHTDTVTGICLSPDGSYLLSNSMDNTLRIWDIRNFVPGERCVKIFNGHQHNFEKNLLRCSWSPDGSKVSAGSADRFVYIWDTTSRRILYKLPGHNGCVNDVDFHPKQPIIASASSDKTLYLGEIDV
ncbi:U5 small nuclear ribonucleoprotein 40 kDa protein [Teleopsis dalmanni]|uniref:U5 small nuclear ribonucleoprotein 40 kDa protein n=1 Tax=Teleopsis dalmanni TaxID=139649 RepID=UPI0018CD1C85|nr:U5 small nuclear ribonucleoprotein 40 kDa protein [Teleopsis dalmanni]